MNTKILAVILAIVSLAFPILFGGTIYMFIDFCGTKSIIEAAMSGVVVTLMGGASVFFCKLAFEELENEFKN